MAERADRLRRLVMDAGRITGADQLLQPWLGGMGAILMLHRVTDDLRFPEGPNRHLSISPRFLDQVLAALREDGFLFVSMDEAVERLRAGNAGGPRFVALTADDGYRDNLTEALPVLERHAAPITVYVAPGLIEGRADLWWDVIEQAVNVGRPIGLGGETLLCDTPDAKRDAFHRLLATVNRDVPEGERTAFVRGIARDVGVDHDLPRRETLMMWEDLEGFARHPLVTIGAHTVHHHNLKRLGKAEARFELEEGRRLIAGRLGRAPRHFAYPYGFAEAVGAREVALAREAGYLSAVTTRHGILREEHLGHLHALPRLSLNGRFQNLAHLRTMLRGLTTPLANGGRRLVTV
ncbi:MAG: polysaccharide deacetylase family protein [Methylobacterium mesophilicum]|nr:polysaccharide deacetylase family protein [Methylobacterium mesophilicum]